LRKVAAQYVSSKLNVPAFIEPQLIQLSIEVFEPIGIARKAFR